MADSNTERDERVRQIRERRNALQLRHGDWPCQTVHNSKERAFQQYILADIDYLLSLFDSQMAAATSSPTPAESESPILAFDKWLMRYVADCGKLSQREYGIAYAAFIAAHPGEGPLARTMNTAPAESTRAEGEQED